MACTVAEDKGWLASQLTCRATRDSHYLTLPGFVESLVRVSLLAGKEAESDSVSYCLRKFLEDINNNDLVCMEGAVLEKELEVRKAKEVLDYHNDILLELYDKNTPATWSNAEIPHHAFGKFSLPSSLFPNLDFLSLLQRSYMLDIATFTPLLSYSTSKDRSVSPKNSLESDEWSCWVCLGKKVFGEECGARRNEFKVGVAKAVEHFLCCAEVLCWEE